MKKLGLLTILLLVLHSCSTSPESSLKHLNGYWEIESVKLSNGTKKELT